MSRRPFHFEWLLLRSSGSVRVPSKWSRLASAQSECARSFIFPLAPTSAIGVVDASSI
jgi:hypothetical protein